MFPVALKELIENLIMFRQRPFSQRSAHIPTKGKWKIFAYDALDENYHQIEVKICAGIIIYPLK